MLFRNKGAIAALSITLFLPATGLAESKSHEAERQADNGIQLSAGLHHLLNQEMVAIENGMQDLIPAIAAGEWERVGSIAQNISNSFIMKQKLTQAQKEELHLNLPSRFIEMDQDFHASAAMLAHAAENKNAEVVNFYFYKLNNACVECHAKYATQRFPALAKDTDKDTHHH